MAQRPRILAIMGSGETAPTMVTTHQQLLARLPSDARAVLIETPYGFQENASEISERAIDFFRRHVGHTLEAIGPRSASDRQGRAWDAAVAALQDADYVFAGPGSPTYALKLWRGTAFADVLATKLRTGGIITFASAAAAGLGRAAVPVYEIYKVGEDPAWVPGLDLLAALDLGAVVIPHFDNAEGGTHDTRFCYLGARRLHALEAQLDAATLVIGVDEHTALIIDADAGTATVRGRGGVTIRREGRTLRTLASGSSIGIEDLERETAGHGQSATGDDAADDVTRSSGDTQDDASAPRQARDGAGPAPGTDSLTLTEQVARCTAAFDAALAERDGPAAAAAILDLESAIAQWSADTTQSDEADRAREALRGLIVRLGNVAAEGLRDPSERLGPLAEVIVRTRAELRQRRDYDLADELRNAAGRAGLELRDTPDGTSWRLIDAR